VTGNVAKDSKYLRTIKNNTKDDNHPRHNGITMQAHHIISAKGVELSGLGSKIEKLGYDINCLENLAFLPSTLQGACHLHIQLHRGNHTTPDADGNHPNGYHFLIKDRLKDLKPLIDKECPGEKNSNRQKILDELNKVSARILRRIEKMPGKAPLTDIYQNFTSGNPLGCCNVDSIPLARDMPTPCSIDRNHANAHNPMQADEGITYPSNSYALQVGK